MTSDPALQPPAELADRDAEIERLKARATETTALLNALFVFRDNANVTIARLRAALATCVEALTLLLQCPEIADCAPEDKDPETHHAESMARAARDAIKAALTKES